MNNEREKERTEEREKKERKKERVREKRDREKERCSNIADGKQNDKAQSISDASKTR
jgi:hypothetical protein